MTKAEIIELVKGWLSSESTTMDMMHRVDKRRLELYISVSYQDMLYEMFKKNTEGLSLYVKTFKDVTVSQDTDTEVWSAEISASIMQLPGTASAIRRISTNKGKTLEFVPVDAEIAEAIGMLDVSDVNINSCIGYCLRNNNLIEFINFPASLSATKLRIDALISFSSYADTDEVYLASGQANVLLQGVIGLLTGRKTVDLVNDNAEENVK